MKTFTDQRPLRIFAALALPLSVMVACSEEGATTQYEFQPTKSIQSTDPGAGGDGTTTVLSSVESSTVPQPGSDGLMPVTLGDGAPSGAVSPSGMLLFDTDKDAVSVQDMNMIQQYAAFLTSHPDTRLVITGHADERGTRAHNADLSQRRAQQVATVLVSMGVPEAQLQTQSYGEEQPLADLKNWAENRRVELTYSNASLLSAR